MKKTLLTLAFPLILFAPFQSYHAQTIDNNRYVEPSVPSHGRVKIQVAILLDTSSSMDGLINQAKSRLWSIVNTLSTLKFQGKDPQLEIALYEYGNNNISPKKDYIRQLTGFTTDLDLISEMLFSLTTNGGDEYCGTVIQRSLSELEWSSNAQSLKLIYIAGNESFEQGEVHYKKAIGATLRHNISLHTIYCGDKGAGIREGWKKAADYAQGKYFNINTNKEIQYRTTPYDDRITELNQQLNQTYYGYGSRGIEYKSKQIVQDENASTMNKSVMTERTLSKSSTKYSNANWDIVDAYNDDKNFVIHTKENEWPDEFKDLTPQQREKKIIELNESRKRIQSEIQQLAKDREKYLNTQTSENDKDDLGYAITESIMDLAKKLNYTQ